MIDLVKINLRSYKMIHHLALYELKISYSMSFFGRYWTVVYDLIYFICYGFFTSVMTGAYIEGVPRFVYLVCGLSFWYILFECLTSGVRCVRSRSSVASKMKVDFCIFPTVVIISVFYKRWSTFLLVFLILVLNNLFGSFSLVGFLYFLSCGFVFVFCVTQLLMPFATLSREFNLYYNAFVRVLMFLVPIFWSFDQVSDGLVRSVLLLNPLVYLIVGMRSALLGDVWFDVGVTIYFWFFCFVSLWLGSKLQGRLSCRFNDYL